MGLKELSIEKSYISYGKNNIVTSLIAPALRVSNVYKRSVGFFASSVFSLLASEIIDFVRNGGRIKLICGIKLSEDDKNAISTGYAHRDAIIESHFSESLLKELDELSDTNLQLLEELIAKGFLDIKLAITKGSGIYHDKDEWDILKTVCSKLAPDEELAFEMMYSLIDIENRSSSINQRNGVLDDLETAIEHTFYKNEEDALQYYTDRINRKKDHGGKYNEKFLANYVRENVAEYGVSDEEEEDVE